MRVPSWLLPAEILLLVGSLQLLPVATAVPSVNIGLKASFDAAPYLVELLETAADEDESVYFALLDHVAAGHFAAATTDRDLHSTFLSLLKDANLFTDPDALSSFELALSIHNSAPRIEAHFQYYRTAVEPLLEKSAAKSCETWLEFAGKQFCSPQLDSHDAVIEGLKVQGEPKLPFDRQMGQDTALPATVYADITSEEFGRFHPLMRKAAEEGKVAYRVRHKPSTGRQEGAALRMSGFGAELALKRTDYIVIDDRNAGTAEKKRDTTEEGLDAEEEVADLTPLSSSELEELSIKAASYIMSSEFPLKRLLKVTQDFPKYSSFLAAQDVSQPFKQEHLGNRELLLPPGYSVLWINGVQYDPRKVDAYSLVDHLRRERRLIASFRDLGFSNAEAIQLLTHPANTEGQQSAEATRYDWRDESEGGNVIMWLNDLAKDKRYEDWPANLMGYLGRTYPGQLPMVKRDLHNLIIPVDFSDVRSVTPVVETMQDFVKRKVPVRFGIVPLAHTEAAIQQGKVAYHVYHAYGISALLNYLESAVAGKKVTTPQENTFTSAIAKRKLRAGFEAQDLQQVLASAETDGALQNADRYLTRLGASQPSPPLFINGIPIKNDDNWLQAFSQQVSIDARNTQKVIWEGTVDDEETWLPSLFLKEANARRNPLVIPEREGEVVVLDLAAILGKGTEGIEGQVGRALESAVVVPADEESVKTRGQLFVVADFGTEHGLRLLLDALKFRQKQTNLDVVLICNTETPAMRASALYWQIEKIKASGEDLLAALTQEVEELLERDPDYPYKGYERKEDVPGSGSPPGEVSVPTCTPLTTALGFKLGEAGLVLNGRKVGSIPPEQTFSLDDFETLYSYEFKKRVLPFVTAINDLGFGDKLKSAAENAKLFSTLALSSVSDMPEGIFELPPPIRTRLFYGWNATHTAFEVGDNSTAAIQIIVAIDPASEVAQQWVPILKVLSELDGVFMRLFLNPTSRLDQLPVKRFYRYALEAKPHFDDSGKAVAADIKFEGIPKDALLTAALHVPPAWLVAPKDSIHDLDNIKLSSLPSGSDLHATYELENILIEGHSRDVTTGIAPRGAQLALSTAKNPHAADTLIMANLGYFQFKANPGYYNISLLPGPSDKIFNIDSVGALGYEPVKGDESTEVTLMSFAGVTLYPRLSRKEGMEEEDVLSFGQAKGKVAKAAEKGAGIVENLLSKVGVKKPQTGNYARKAHAYLSNALANTPLEAVASSIVGPPAKKQAEINIFSVASGHLYERMLNIMMVSVMKHTTHTVKFWFIEQFLSSSFKAFLPTLATEYGFEFEFVTYKWPHWLRAQKEKQREIWGYKILFLDVLFPLDLDKVIFVDADQIVRADMMELVEIDLKGAPYGFVPMGDSRTEMEGFRFWKQGYWKNFLRGLPYHISALYVVDLQRFRQIAAGDRLRQQYHQLSADPGSLANLDQDLPNNMQMAIPIHTLPQDWLWCETWCSDESLATAKTIDLCNNPMTKEPKLERARRQVPEWTVYDEEIAALARRTLGGAAEVLSGGEQERLQVEEREAKRREEEAEAERQKEKTPEHGEL